MSDPNIVCILLAYLAQGMYVGFIPFMGECDYRMRLQGGIRWRRKAPGGVADDQGSPSPCSFLV